MNSLSVQPDCGTAPIPLTTYELHIASCSACVAKASKAIKKTVVKKNDVKATVNRSTYKCPFC